MQATAASTLVSMHKSLLVKEKTWKDERDAILVAFHADHEEVPEGEVKELLDGIWTDSDQKR